MGPLGSTTPPPLRLPRRPRRGPEEHTSRTSSVVSTALRARKRRGRSPLLPKCDNGAETAARRRDESAGTAEKADHDDREGRGEGKRRRRRRGGKDDQDDTGTAKDEARLTGKNRGVDSFGDLPLGLVRSFAIIIVFTCIFVGLNTVVVVVVVVVVSLIRLRILTLIILILIAAPCQRSD